MYALPPSYAYTAGILLAISSVALLSCSTRKKEAGTSVRNDEPIILEYCIQEAAGHVSAADSQGDLLLALDHASSAVAQLSFAEKIIQNASAVLTQEHVREFAYYKKRAHALKEEILRQARE